MGREQERSLGRRGVLGVVATGALLAAARDAPAAGYARLVLLTPRGVAPVVDGHRLDVSDRDGGCVFDLPAGVHTIWSSDPAVGHASLVLLPGETRALRLGGQAFSGRSAW